MVKEETLTEMMTRGNHRVSYSTNLKPGQHKEHLSITSATKKVVMIGGPSKVPRQMGRMRVSQRTPIMEADLTFQRRRSKSEGDSS